MLLSGSNTALPEPRGLLMSPPVVTWPGHRRCVHFSYYMSGLGADSCILRLHVLTSSGTLRSAIWSQNGQQRGMWKEATVELTENKPFQVN